MWNLISLEARTSSAGAVDTDIVGVFQDGSKKPVAPKGPYAAPIGKFRKSGAFVARQAQLQFVRFGGKGGAESVLFAGMGVATELTPEKARAVGGNVMAKLVAEKAKKVSVRLDTVAPAKLPAGADSAEFAYAFAEGLVLAAYEFTKHRSRKEGEASFPAKIFFVTADKALKATMDRKLREARAVAAAVQVTRDWSNEPSNYGTPEYYAEEAKKLAKEYDLKCTVLTEKDAEREKMGLFLGVGRGAEREGRVVVVEYTPKKVTADTKTIAFVGKGVTFDSGGISIKPSLRMEEMKHDMTGAATVMGATLLAAELGVKNRIVTIMGFTENMPDGTAIQPGNVITSRAGKTVEIINTDAEGRLVLADVLDYAHEFKPDCIVNAATLTGAVQIALGKHCCAILGNDQELIDNLRQIGEATGERMWQLPLWDEYFEDLKSDTADMKNSANDSSGGTIRGAIFLKQFIRKGTAWAHLDIAAVAAGISHVPYFPKKGGTGVYVRSLARFAAQY